MEHIDPVFGLTLALVLWVILAIIIVAPRIRSNIDAWAAKRREKRRNAMRERAEAFLKLREYARKDAARTAQLARHRVGV
jgi:F0F1-type ATP synthase membrane subunit b/b'